MIYLQTLILSAKTAPERVIVPPSASASRLVHPTVPLVPTVAFPVSIFATAPVNPSFYFWGRSVSTIVTAFILLLLLPLLLLLLRKMKMNIFWGPTVAY